MREQVGQLQAAVAAEALKPVRDALDAKRAAHKEAVIDFSKRHNDLLEAGLASRLRDGKVDVDALLAAVPGLLRDVQAIR